MYAILPLKHAFLEGVHSPYTEGASRTKGITESPLRIAPKHTIEYFQSNSTQTIEFGETGSGRRN